MPKIVQSLQQHISQVSPEQPVRVIVRYRGTPEAAVTRAAVAGRVTTYRLVPFAALELSAQRVQSLAELDTVEQVWPDLPVHIWLQQSIVLLGVPQVWATGDRGQGIVIAVVDTGIDVTHPDLQGRVTLTKDFSGEGFQDNHGHGTHVAGIIAGNGSASNGEYSGVAPEATLIAAKVLKGDGSGLTSDVMAGVEWAVQNGAHVINLSLGSDGSCDGTDPLSQMCDAAVDAGAVVCVAAGNAGPTPRTVGSPGCAAKPITVGATDVNDHVASFSSRGPTADNRIKPDICFPGVAIVSCRAHGTSMGQTINEFYTSASGTSMATPHCSGAAALLLQADRSRKPQDIKNLLMNSAKDLNTDVYAQGRGRAQVYEAYLGHETPPPPPPPPSDGGGGCSQVIRRFWQVLPIGRT